MKRKRQRRPHRSQSAGELRADQVQVERDGNSIVVHLTGEALARLTHYANKHGLTNEAALILIFKGQLEAHEARYREERTP